MRRTLIAAVVVILAVAGFVANQVVHQFEDTSRTMASSHALDGAPPSTDGGTTILLMGLDTRKDQNGQQLPKEILDQLHAGDGNEGGYNTNTLILMHIPAGEGQVQAFSIPRDDAVNVPGYGVHKIKEAYGLAKDAAEGRLAKQGVTDPHALETQSRDAGRKAELDTVRTLTGVHIDHLAEVSLPGFYDLANALGGVEVCLNQPVRDDEYSGANFPAGDQILNGKQALAFVRQRHGLTNGDLDRTHRQQAFLASASHIIRSRATLSSPSKMTSLTDAAKRDVVIDHGWSAWPMAKTLQKLTGATTLFQTLPITGFITVNGGSANEIDPSQIRSLVQSTFSANTGPPSPAGNAVLPHPAAPAGNPPAPAPPPAPRAQGPQGPPVTATSTGIPCVN